MKVAHEVESFSRAIHDQLREVFIEYFSSPVADPDIISQAIHKNGFAAVLTAIRSTVPATISSSKFSDPDKVVIALAYYDKGMKDKTAELLGKIIRLSGVGNQSLISLAKTIKSEPSYMEEVVRRINSNDEGFIVDFVLDAQRSTATAWFVDPHAKKNNMDLLKIAMSKPGTEFSRTIFSVFPAIRYQLIPSDKLELAETLLSSKNAKTLFPTDLALFTPLAYASKVIDEAKDSEQFDKILNLMVDYADWVNTTHPEEVGKKLEHQVAENITVGEFLKNSFLSGLDKLSGALTLHNASTNQASKSLYSFATVLGSKSGLDISPEDGVIRLGLAIAGEYNEKMDSFIHKHSGGAKLSSSEFEQIVDEDWKLKMVMGLISDPVVHKASEKNRKIDNIEDTPSL